jgi:hypothetical protein
VVLQFLRLVHLHRERSQGFSSRHWRTFSPGVPYYHAETSYVQHPTGIFVLALGTPKYQQLGIVPYMTSIPVETLITKLDYWLSLLDTVRVSFQNQVTLLDSAQILLLDSALPNLTENQQFLQALKTLIPPDM